MNFVAFLLLFCSIVFAQDQFQNDELIEEVLDIPAFSQDLNQTPSIQNPQNSIETKMIYLSIQNFSKNILYLNEIVPLDVKLLVLSQYTSLQTKFIQNDNSTEVLNPNEAWKIEQDGTLTNRFFIKIKSQNYQMPQIQVSITSDNKFESAKTPEITGKAISLDRGGNFSQVIAQSLQIKDTKITSYDLQNNLVVIHLEAQMSNLFDFRLKYEQQGLESVSGDFLQAFAYYYAIIPKSQESLTFDYFNREQSSYVTLRVENQAHDEKISTQSDIKPKNNIQVYQLLFLGIVALVSIALFLYKRKWFFLLPLVGVYWLAFYILSAKTQALLKPNALIRIQPTYNSTIIHQDPQSIEVEIITHQRGYYKVIFKDDRIGWVLDDDIQN